MAETAQEKIPSLAEDKEKSDHAEVSVEKTTGDEKPVDATSEEAVPEKTDETPVADETKPVAEESSETPEQEETKSTPEQEGTESTPVQEETEPTPVQEVTKSQEVTAEEPVIKLETAPADFRFPTTNQTRHCFTRYIEYHKCIAAKGEGASECEKFAKYYRSLCPSEWIERWDEQRANGTFPGPL